MGELLLVLLPAIVLVALIWGLATALSPRDTGLSDAEKYQRDLAELLRVKLGVGTVDEALRRVVHAISHTRPELALTARLRAADTRQAALADVLALEKDARVPAGTADHLRELLTAAYAA